MFTVYKNCRKTFFVANSIKINLNDIIGYIRNSLCDTRFSLHALTDSVFKHSSCFLSSFETAKTKLILVLVEEQKKITTEARAVSNFFSDADHKVSSCFSFGSLYITSCQASGFFETPSKNDVCISILITSK